MAIRILGISAFYHDSAAALVVDGEVIAAAQEERFTRVKNDPSFPVNAIEYVLREGGLDYADLTAIAFYDKPLLKFERLLETYHAMAPYGLRSFMKAMPVWIKDKLFTRRLLRKQMPGAEKIPFLFPEHHLSHAASAYYPSPFEDAAILTIDGVGEWATTTIGEGSGAAIEILTELRFPHSVGLLYSAFTYYLGFKVNSGEYKLMGLAPYGYPGSAPVERFRQQIVTELVDIREDGSILLNMDYFDFAVGLTMTRDRKWEALFGLGRREPESDIDQSHKDFALAIQQVTESIVVALARTAGRLTGKKNLVMAGGVALNCVSNSKIAGAGIFDRIWVQPAAGDAGGALGAAYAASHIGYGQPRRPVAAGAMQKPNASPADVIQRINLSPADAMQGINLSPADAMRGAYLGPAYTDADIERVIRKHDAAFGYFDRFSDLSGRVAALLAEGKVVGWFQGRMEFGPRALGNRSILGDPRNPDMQKTMNLKIKFRESFRPFAPSVLEEVLTDHFDMDTPSPYMLFTGQALHPEAIPAVAHVDGSSRVQTVNKETNPRFWQLITDFNKITGCPMLINTSFNVRGEPIVCTPHDAYQGFLRTGMDNLVMGNYLLSKLAPR